MKQTHSLDGTWQVIYDHDNKGRTLNLQQRENFYACEDLEQITVPACLEEFKQDYEGVAWYGKTFTLPDNWQNKTIRPLNFEAANYRAEIWVNAKPLAQHEGGYIGFELLIDDLLTEGKNFIAVRVITPLILATWSLTAWAAMTCRTGAAQSLAVSGNRYPSSLRAPCTLTTHSLHPTSTRAKSASPAHFKIAV